MDLNPDSATAGCEALGKLLNLPYLSVLIHKMGFKIFDRKKWKYVKYPEFWLALNEHSGNSSCYICCYMTEF